ncbi:MAG: single-stranded DNA-binding protein [Spirochaetes bacterium]|nr:MAG: single-stranded DNA-binding protein [Spirochaetota bacterium]
MADINHVVVVGRLTRDAELKYTNNGYAVSKVSIAVNQRRKINDQWTDEVSFFDVVIWGKTAEALKDYLVKGKQIGIEGKLHQSRWEQEGKQRSRVEIVASNIQLLGGNRSSTSPSPGTSSNGAFPEAANTANKEFPDNFDDDIPF